MGYRYGGGARTRRSCRDDSSGRSDQRHVQYGFSSSTVGSLLVRLVEITLFQTVNFELVRVFCRTENILSTHADLEMRGPLSGRRRSAARLPCSQ